MPLVFLGVKWGCINRHQKISLVAVQYFSLLPEDQVEELPGVWAGVDLVGPCPRTVKRMTTTMTKLPTN